MSSVSRETDRPLRQLLRTMRRAEGQGYRIRKIRISRLGCEGGPISYLDRQGEPIVLIHPTDWRRQLRAEILDRGLTDGFLTGHQNGTLYGIPFEIEGQEPPPRIRGGA